MGNKGILVKAIYDDAIYEASVLMAVVDDNDDCFDLLRRLQSIIDRKKLKGCKAN